MTAHLSRRLLAEALGTALLIVFGPGSVVAALALGEGSLDYAGLGMIALSFGLVIAVVIYAFGAVSGAHINPVVSVALAATGRFPWRELGPYIAAQLAGALVGGLLVVAAFGRRAADLGAVGSTALAEGVGVPQALVAEALGTFLLMLAIMGLAVDRRAPVGWAGLMIGLSVTCVILVVGPLTGASLNPARTLGPYVTAALFGGEVRWADLPVYLVGPLIGAVLAAVGYDFVAQPEGPEEGSDRQGAQGEVVGSRV
ncbi:MAG: aquaporin family protein [Actinomycetota bacterium]|nr:aquaporin family protein [Actinomycetota bacterium]